MVIVDSSIWIEAARREGDLGSKMALECLLEEYEAATTSPVLLEVLGGARGQDRRRMADYFSIIPHVQTEPKDWENALSMAWLLRDRGVTVPWNDMLIAAMALRRDMRVFARDKHFESISNHTGLALYHPGYGGSYSPGPVEG